MTLPTFATSILRHSAVIIAMVAVIYMKLVKASNAAHAEKASESAAHGSSSGHGNSSSSHHSGRYQIAQFEWDKVEGPFTISLWLLLAGVAKIGFKISKKVASLIPDSSLLIILGLIVGTILFLANTGEDTYKLNDHIFFIFLLPPIVFDAGYFMPSRAFFNNLGSILTYAVIGTIWNIMTIGFSLWAVSLAGVFTVETSLLHIMIFASLISAVDPVAVLVVFEEIHVNEVLFIVVFGESLLNDAVTVVLYHMFESFTAIGASNLIPQDFIFGFISFFVVALGGVIIGVLWALLAGFTTRFTKCVRVLEPLFIFVMAYCSYLTAEMLKLSSIMAIAFCGIVMRPYVEGNISQKSQTTVKYFLKMLSNGCETIIFMFLGLSTVSTSHHWDTAFVGLTVLFCLVYRAIGVVIQTYFVNKARIHKLNKVDQFIMAYGGLRGAIAYGLAVAMPDDLVPAKNMFITATIVVIYFTVFLQGMTIKPLVNFLKVKKEEKRNPTMNEQIFQRVKDFDSKIGKAIIHTTAGIEMIAGQFGRNQVFAKYDYYNTKYVKPVILKEPPLSADIDIVETFNKLQLKEAIDMARTKSLSSFASSRTSLNNLKVNSVSMSTANFTNAVSRKLSSRSNKYSAAYSNPAFSSDEKSPRKFPKFFLGSGKNEENNIPNSGPVIVVTPDSDAPTEMSHLSFNRTVSGDSGGANGDFHRSPSNTSNQSQNNSTNQRSAPAKESPDIEVRL